MKFLLVDCVILNMVVYCIDCSNIVQVIGDVVDGVNQLVVFGLVCSIGMELDLLVDVIECWVVNLIYVYNDVCVKDMGLIGIINVFGDCFVNVLQNKLGLWICYDLLVINFVIGFGVDYVGECVSLDGQVVKVYIVFDMSWKIMWKQWQYQVNVKNFFDRVYVVSGFIECIGYFLGEFCCVYV